MSCSDLQRQSGWKSIVSLQLGWQRQQQLARLCPGRPRRIDHPHTRNGTIQLRHPPASCCSSRRPAPILFSSSPLGCHARNTLLHFTLLFYCLLKEWKHHRSTCLISTHWDFSALGRQSQIQPGNSAFTFSATYCHQVIWGQHLSFSQLYHSPRVSLIPRNAWLYILFPQKTSFTTRNPGEGSLTRYNSLRALHLGGVWPMLVSES